jgi:hypothetical protein
MKARKDEAWYVIWKVRTLLIASNRLLRPLTIAKRLGFSRGEVELALWLLRKDDMVFCTHEGYWYKKVQS